MNKNEKRSALMRRPAGAISKPIRHMSKMYGKNLARFFPAIKNTKNRNVIMTRYRNAYRLENPHVS
jgi:ribosome biogenesis protein Nip4